MALPNGHATFSSIPDAIASFGKRLPRILTPHPTSTSLTTPPAAGNPLIVLDSPSRENEGDLILAASDCTPSKTAFLIHHTSGYLCAPLPSSLADRLDLPPMVPAAANTDPNRTAYTVTIDAASDVTTGISATDRARTCRLLADPSAEPGWFRRPGHVIPLRAREGGVRERQGHTEAAVEFCRLAGKAPVGVIGELVARGEELEGVAERKGEEGMMGRDECLEFGRRYGLCVVTIEDLVRWLEEGGDRGGKGS